MRIPKSFDETILDEVVIVVLSLVSVGLLVVEVAGSTSPAQGRLLEQIDFGIALMASFSTSTAGGRRTVGSPPVRRIDSTP